MEEYMPWPHMDVALDAEDITPKQHLAYMTQLSYRNHIDTLHQHLYTPTDYLGDKLRQPAYIDSKLEKVIETHMLSLDAYAGLEEFWKSQGMLRELTV